MSLSATPKAFRVLAFGASLTEGFVGGWTPYPYAAHLQAPLEAFFSKDATVKIVIDGQGGDQVVSPPGRFLPRLEKHCQKGEDRYDWILVMGGTNDIGGGTKAEEVYQGLKKCWTVALNSGAKVLAMNILEAGYPDKTLIQTRKTLNTLILDHKEKNVYPMDICSEIPYFSMDEKQRKEIWLPDALHLTRQGYKLMGDKVAEKLLGILKEEKDAGSE